MKKRTILPLVSIFIFTLLMLTQLAIADFTVFNESQTEAWIVISNFMNASDNYPAGWRTRGWLRFKPGTSRILAVSPNTAKVYLHITHPYPSEIKPSDHASRENAAWLVHPSDAFTAVEKADGTGTLLKSDKPANELIRKTLYGYPNGGSVRISAEGRLLVGTDANE